jgi:uncharacterized protein
MWDITIMLRAPTQTSQPVYHSTSFSNDNFDMGFKYHNAPTNADGPPPSPLPSPFILNAPPGTDIWKKPPSHDAFDAPIVYQTLKLSSFQKAQVRISAEWKTLFDQGGICLVLPAVPGAPSDSARKWVKTGVEFFNHKPHVSTVACDRWADWSLWPMRGNTVTIELEREVKHGQPTSTMWVYAVEGDTRLPVREISWFFAPEHLDAECWVGLYAAKPTKEEKDPSLPLEVSFHDFLISASGP